MKYYFLYKRIGKRQTWNLWAIVEVEEGNNETVGEMAERLLFTGDFKYEFIIAILINS